MNNITALIDSETVKGTGKNLYALIKVDQFDFEDTNIELWKADDEDHLYSQVFDDFYDGIDPENYTGPIFDDEIWGLIWLPKLIGVIK